MKEDIIIERDGQAVHLSDTLAAFSQYAERKGILPPSGKSEEELKRRDEWFKSNLNPCRKVNL